MLNTSFPSHKHDRQVLRYSSIRVALSSTVSALIEELWQRRVFQFDFPFLCTTCSEGQQYGKENYISYSGPGSAYIKSC